MNDTYEYSEDSEQWFDLYVNTDSPDIEHLDVYNEDTQEEERCIRVTMLDHSGDPVHCIFNLQSLNYLMDSLLYSKQSLQESKQSQDDEEWLENV